MMLNFHSTAADRRRQLGDHFQMSNKSQLLRSGLKTKLLTSGNSKLPRRIV